MPAIRRPEEELLLHCARVELEAERRDRIRELASSALAWPEVVRLAEEHRVLPLVSTHLGATEGAAPPDVLQLLRQKATQNVKRSLLLTNELREVLQLFASAGIRAIPYKGPVLAQQLYGTVAFREMGDLDILIAKHQVTAAQELLFARGYLQPEALTPLQQRAVLRSDCNSAFVRPGAYWITLELHWAFAPGRSTFPLDFGDLETRLTSVSLAGAEFPAFSNEDLLLILCHHGAKHMWERLEWICGIAELIRKGSVDWAVALDRAERLGSKRTLLLGASLANRLLGASLPAIVHDQVARDAMVAWLTSETCENLFSGNRALAHTRGWPFHRYQLRAKDSTWGKVRYLYHCTVAPGKEDWAAVPLPEALFPMYFLIRPIRLAGQYGLRLARSSQ